MSFNKWLAAGFGWIIAGGPIGALLGFGVVTLLEKISKNKSGKTNHQAEFQISLLVLSAYVIKADGRVDQKELDYVRASFRKMFGAESAEESFRLFKKVINDDKVSLRSVCLQIREKISHPERLQLIHFLYNLSLADGVISEEEIHVIQKVGVYFNISPKDMDSIKAMFYKAVDGMYKILEVEPTVSDKELKKAYRKMALKYHPDKLEQMSETVKEAAREKFMKVQEAYDTIKKERGI